MWDKQMREVFLKEKGVPEFLSRGQEICEFSLCDQGGRSISIWDLLLSLVSFREQGVCEVIYETMGYVKFHSEVIAQMKYHSKSGEHVIFLPKLKGEVKFSY